MAERARGSRRTRRPPTTSKPIASAPQVNGLVAAVTAVARTLDEMSIPYMVIGGFAVTIWGEPRLTQDVDATITCQTDATDVIRRLVEALPARTNDPEG